jgi:ATP-binding cassette subfamily B protein
MSDFDDEIELENDIDAEQRLGEPGIDPSSLSAAWQLIRPILTRFRWSIVWLGLAVLVDTAFNISFPLVERLVIDDGFVPHDWSVVGKVIIYIVFSAIAVTAVGLVMDVLNARISSGVIAQLRNVLLERLGNLPSSYFYKTEGGEILSRFSTDVMAVEDGLTAIVPWILLPGLEVIYTTALMFAFNMRLALVGLLVFPVNLLASRHFSSRAFALGFEKRRRESRLLSTVAETISAQPVIRAFGLVKMFQRRFKHLSDDWRKTTFQFDLQSALVDRASYAGVYFVHALVFGIGAYWTFEGVISLGTLVAFEAMFLTMGDAISHVTEAIPMLAEASGGFRQLRGFMEERTVAPDLPDAADLAVPRQSIRLQDVTFRYPGAKFKLGPIDLDIPIGKKTAIVGKSGSGKSTLVQLLLRSETPLTGTISMDGRDIRTATISSLRRLIAPVFQETFLFHDTLEANISLGRPGVNPGDMYRAAEAAEISDFILSLPQAYKTNVGERGAKLSGGQRQRIAIARALFADPAILVLDEASSALDPQTEKNIRHALLRIAGKHTLISITHRLESIKDFENIVVLDRGRIREQGSHRTLLKQRGLYFELWTKQQDS